MKYFLLLSLLAGNANAIRVTQPPASASASSLGTTVGCTTTSNIGTGTEYLDCANKTATIGAASSVSGTLQVKSTSTAIGDVISAFYDNNAARQVSVFNNGKVVIGTTATSAVSSDYTGSLIVSTAAGAAPSTRLVQDGAGSNVLAIITDDNGASGPTSSNRLQFVRRASSQAAGGADIGNSTVLGEVDFNGRLTSDRVLATIVGQTDASGIIASNGATSLQFNTTNTGAVNRSEKARLTANGTLAVGDTANTEDAMAIFKSSVGASANAIFRNSSGNTIVKMGASSGFTVGSAIAFSSAPISFISGNTAASLASGTTFYSVPKIQSAITLVAIGFDVDVAGVSGAGDTFVCGDGGTNFISVTVSAAAAAGTFTESATSSANIAYGSNVKCYISSTAATKPIGNVVVEYILQ